MNITFTDTFFLIAFGYILRRLNLVKTFTRSSSLERESFLKCTLPFAGDCAGCLSVACGEKVRRIVSGSGTSAWTRGARWEWIQHTFRYLVQSVLAYACPKRSPGAILQIFVDIRFITI